MIESGDAVEEFTFREALTDGYVALQDVTVGGRAQVDMKTSWRVRPSCAI
jgi:hypothetical protein